MISVHAVGTPTIVFATSDEPTPMFNVHVKGDFVHVYHWPANANLMLTIDDPTNGPGIDLARFATVDSAGNGFSIKLAGLFDIQGGHIVSVTDGQTTKTHIVTNVRVDSADVFNDTVSGTAAPNSAVWVVDWQGIVPSLTVVADASGNWIADYNTIGFDLQPNHRGEAVQWDDDGDTTQFGWFAYLTKVVGITQVLAKEHGQQQYRELLTPQGSSPALIMPGDAGSGPFMPEIKCRAIRLDDPNLTTSTTFRWKITLQILGQNRPVPTNNNLYESNQYENNENIWLVDWEGHFYGGTMNLYMEADANGDGTIDPSSETDTKIFTILGENPQSDEVKSLLALGGVGACNGGVMKAICHRESNFKQFGNDGYALKGIDNPNDRGLMQLNYSGYLDGSIREGLWNWKDNIDGGRMHLQAKLGWVDTKRAQIKTHLQGNYVPLQFTNDFDDEKIIRSALTRWNGTYYGANSAFQPGQDSAGHTVYYGAYYHPEVSGDEEAGYMATWEPNPYPPRTPGQDMRYADIVYSLYINNYSATVPITPVQQQPVVTPTPPVSLNVEVHSPVALFIIDPMSRCVGLDPMTQLVFLEVPNAVYADSSIMIPQPVPGFYLVKLMGTGEGDYTLNVAAGENTQTFTGYIMPNQIADYCLFLRVSPLSSLAASGAINDNGWFYSPVSIELSATDQDGSGVAWVEYSLDNGNSWIRYDQPFILNTGGRYTILHRAIGYNDTVEEAKSAIVPVITFVTIDIKPGSYPNFINLGSRGVIPIAILSSESFDATQVDPDTVQLAGSEVAIKGKGNTLAHQEDVNGDSLLDLVVQVETENLDPDEFQDGEAILTGQTYGGDAIEGSDGINIVPPEQAAPARPTEFALLQNYPSISNPDTWIPYQLTEDVDVRIRIYDVSGQLVRTLNLGTKPAGFYTTKDRSAYWDGKNEAGEQVASGIYFYTIQAGDYTATKKMVVAK